MPLIKCGNHQHAPGLVVCVHLFEGTSKQWCRLPSGDGEVDDWVCPDCFDRLFDLTVDDLRTVCMHCARRMRREAECDKAIRF
jgi:hypothetical protein